ncbi:TonB-dependent receptor [Teredinibacter turnerae]|uniref:TonB-dependent receptor n=1 Tax=Teredinibacter turnerae TaxID=2426 RepID=UPI00040138B6|nr:TonB-dependent receptor [Teredinibacter turnerae]
MTLIRGITSRPKALTVAIGCALWGSVANAQNNEALDELDSGVIIEEVVVWGLRASQARAIDMKRSSDRIVDSIVAEDIGRMPDTTITDSLQRVPGVQINREANEGTSLNVRGMPQVLTTLNGEQFLSPWTITGVGANYSDIPAGMIGGADVYKSMSANNIAGGISGLVNLKTLDPAELEYGWTGKFAAELSEGSLKSDEITDSGQDHDLTIYLGHKSDRFAIMVGAFNSKTNAANYQIAEDQRLAFLDTKGGTPSDPLDLDYDYDYVNDWYLVPDNFSANSNFMERERTGASLGMHFQISDAWSARADVFYTNMQQHDRGVKAQFSGLSSIDAFEVNGSPPTDEEELYNVLQQGTRVGYGHDITYVDSDGVTQQRSLHALHIAEVQSAQFQSISGSEINRTGALNSNLQFDYDNGDNIEASIRYVHGEADRELRQAELVQGSPAWLWIDQDGISGKDALTPYNVTVDYTQDIPSFSFDANLADSNLLQKYQANADGEDIEATLDVLRADLTLKLDGAISSIDMGIRHGVRTAEKNAFYYVTPTGRYSSFNDPRVPADKRFLLREGNEQWERYPMWRDFDYEDENIILRTTGGLQDNGFNRDDTVVYSDFGPIKGFENGISAIDPSVWDNTLDFMNSLYPGTKTLRDPSASYEVEEASTSAYVQMNFEGEWGLSFHGNVGARIVNTTRSVDKAIVPQVLDRFNSTGYDYEDKVVFLYDIETVEDSFVDVLPSFNLNVELGLNTMWRFAAAQTMARNDLENVGSGLVLTYQPCIKTDQNGNPVTVLDQNGNEVTEDVACVREGTELGDAEIEPWRATVWNSSVEWYFAENALLSAGLFMINVDSSVELYQEQRNFVDGDGINRGHLANVWVTDNAGASDLYGFEFGYRQPFTFLPGILKSTGVEFNYTYSNSESADVDVDGEALPLPSNSEHQTNVILWLEKDAFSFRLAYNWRSEEYIDRVRLTTNETPLSLGNWQEATGYLDFSMGYWFNDYVSVYFKGTNLTEENRKTYSQYSDQFHSLWVQERRLALGLSVSI